MKPGIRRFLPQQFLWCLPSSSYRAHNSSGLPPYKYLCKKMSIIILRIPGRLAKNKLRLLCTCRRWWNVRWSFRDRLKLHFMCQHPSPFPNPESKLRSPAFQADSLPSEPPGKPFISIYSVTKSNWTLRISYSFLVPSGPGYGTRLFAAGLGLLSSSGMQTPESPQLWLMGLIAPWHVGS